MGGLQGEIARARAFRVRNGRLTCIISAGGPGPYGEGMVTRAIPLVLSCLVMAAHVFRMGGGVPALAVLLLPAMLLFPWGARALRWILALFALEWVRTAAFLAAGRMLAGEPFVRLLVILLSVAAFTLWSLTLLPRRR